MTDEGGKLITCYDCILKTPLTDEFFENMRKRDLSLPLRLEELKHFASNLECLLNETQAIQAAERRVREAERQEAEHAAMKFENHPATDPTDEVLTVFFRAGGIYHLSLDGRFLVSSPLQINALLPFGEVDIACDPDGDPAQATVGDDDLFTAESFAVWVIEELRPSGLAMLLHPDLLLPLSDGSQATTLDCLSTIHQILMEAGIPVEVEELGENPDFPVDQWIRFTEDYVLSGQNKELVVKGMLGKVEPDDYGICTPGISAYVSPVGKGYTYGFPDDVLEPISPPQPDEIERARILAGRAWEDLREREVWIGLVLPGIPVEKAFYELKRDLAQIRQYTDPKMRRGLLKRVTKLLDGFRFSPAGEASAELTARCRTDLHASIISETILTDIERWIDDCLSQ